MPIACDFRIRNDADTATRVQTTIILDYADEPSLPQHIKWRDLVWRKVAAQAGYRPFPGLPMVDLDGADANKIVEV